MSKDTHCANEDLQKRSKKWDDDRSTEEDFGDYNFLLVTWGGNPMDEPNML